MNKTKRNFWLTVLAMAVGIVIWVMFFIIMIK